MTVPFPDSPNSPGSPGSPGSPERGQEGFEFDLAFSVDLDERLLTHANPMGSRVLGIAETPVSLDAVLDAADISMLIELHDEILLGTTWTGTLRLRPTAIGQRKLQAVVVSDLSSTGGRLISLIATELTRPDQVLAELAHRATHDSLTGLPNRALLFDRLGLALARARRNERPVALLFIDFDEFKRINDTKGHKIGDRVLVDAATTMSLALRPTDTIARMGGDEFVVLCGEINEPADAQLIAGRIRQRLLEQMNPSTLRPVTASIGIAVSLSGDVDAETLLAAADHAMYEAKSRGPGEIAMRTLDDEPLDIQPPPGPVAVRAALFAGELKIGASAVIDLHTGVVAQVEVWPVWVGHSGERYVATEFVNPDIDSELSGQLDMWSLQAARNTHDFFSTSCGDRAPRVTTNLSSGTAIDRELCTTIDALFATCGRPLWNALGLEFSERALAMASNASIQTLDNLDAMGIALTIDGFGSGSLPLQWLAQGPVRCAKLDPALTDEFPAATAVAHDLGLAAIACDISTHAELDEAVRSGCDGAQGPLFGTDVDPGELLDLINGRYPMDFW